MPLSFGSRAVSKLYVGSTQARQAYLGRVALLSSSALAQWESLGAAPAWGSELSSLPWQVSVGGSANGAITSQAGTGTVQRWSFAAGGNRWFTFNGLTQGALSGLGGWLHSDVAGTISVRSPDQASPNWTAIPLVTGWQFVWLVGLAAATSLVVALDTSSASPKFGDGLARNMAVDRWKCGTLP